MPSKTKRWRPRELEKYWFVNISAYTIHVIRTEWQSLHLDKFRLKSGNVFRTRKEAQKALRRILEVLKG